MSANDPTPSIEAAHRAHLESLPFADVEDFAAADRGFLGTVKEPQIKDANGTVIWDTSTYEFISGDAPTSVHPSLWRQSLLCAKHGIYEVIEGIYQVRGLDLSVMTVIESDTGVIVVDPLISPETAAAGWGLYREVRGDRPIRAVVFTHSHIDHFGGVLGVVSHAQVEAGEVEVIAPAGFIDHAISENVYAGTAMSRRAGYMYGASLVRGPRGQVGAGLAQTTSTGQPGIMVPTIAVERTGESHVIDGLEMEFQMAPGSEAPAEFHFYLPRYRALCMAENVSHTMHNIITLRGAVVRDSNAWARYLTQALAMFGDRTDVMFNSHHWPTWGHEHVVTYISLQRDLYKYLHDQTLRMLNRGMTGPEIAEDFPLPPALENSWGARGYYGSVSHNVKGIYQRYMGWFDGNPARLWPHPPQEQARRYVAAMGGVDRVVDLAAEAYAQGDFRWAATLLDHAVFADAGSSRARNLYADTLEQLGYGAENGTWRNFFLSGATELREGNFGTPAVTSAPEILAQMTPEQIFDAIAVTVNGPAAWDLDLALDVVLTDMQRTFRLTLRNGVLVAREGVAGEAPTRLALSKPRLLGMLGGDLESPGIVVSGEPGTLAALLGVLEPGDPGFDIVTP